MSKVHVFVDLDNTLICADILNYYTPKNAKVLELKDTNEIYYARLRPGAKELLNGLRSKYDVVMVTSAIKEYANGWNKLFELGFNPEQIVAREDLKSEIDTAPKSKDYFVLIDDLPALHGSTALKIRRLTKNDPKFAIINLPGYLGRDDSVRQHITEKMITEIHKVIDTRKTGNKIRVYDDGINS